MVSIIYERNEEMIPGIVLRITPNTISPVGEEKSCYEIQF